LKQYSDGIRALELDLAAQISPQLSELLDVLQAASVLVDTNGLVVRASTSALTLGLVQSHMLVHKPLAELVDRARARREAIDGEYELVTGLRGERSYVYARAGRIDNNLVLLMVEDRTEAKRLDDTRRDFIANISHELKTPIAAIGLLAETLVDGIEDQATVKRFAGNIKRESQRLGSLVQDIIQLSKVQATDGQLGFEPVDLYEVISAATENNSVLADTKNIAVQAASSPGHMVFGNREALIMAVGNLIQNAILYSDDAKQVGVGMRVVDGVVEVSVIDSGVGISVDDQERIFERFYRVDQSRSRATGGTGLGLAIVKHVALNHRGDVRVFSKPGMGSTFTLRIPEMPVELTEMLEVSE
jgi:two-component system sensor histidine kinase SenX3